MGHVGRYQNLKDPFDEWYPASGGDVVKFDPTEVLARFYDPTIGRMGLLATEGITRLTEADRDVALL